jgi:hypothetical protein
LSDPLLTLFTAPKPFIDSHIVTIQRNTLNSWKALGNQVEILVMGNDEGISDNAHELEIRHIPNVICNSKGTPLISSMLSLAREASTSPYLGIINADILLFPDLLQAIQAVAGKFKKFLLVGQRWDMEVLNQLSEPNQFLDLKRTISSKAILHPPMGSDYFIFPRECYPEIPDFAIGRAGWDNWFIYKSRLEGWPVIDCTHDVTIVHQDHDYRHLPGGQPHYRLPETAENVEKGGGEHTIFTLFDAQFELVNGMLLRRELTPKKMLREVEISPLTFLRSQSLGRLFYLISRPRKAYAEIRKILFRTGNQ